MLLEGRHSPWCPALCLARYSVNICCISMSSSEQRESSSWIDLKYKLQGTVCFRRKEKVRTGRVRGRVEKSELVFKTE